MTSSSKRATGQATVRTTPAGQVTGAGAWFLDELAEPNAPTAAGRAARAAAAQVNAEERARLIDEGYARGLADGEAKARATAQAHIREAMMAIRAVSAKLTEATTMAPGVLEE